MSLAPYYQDDAVTLYHGDCRVVLPQLERVDHIITDPPYSEHVHAKQWIGAALTEAGAKRVKTAHKALGFDALSDDLRALVAAEAARVCSRWCAVFCDLEGIAGWRLALGGGLDYVRTLIWDKVDAAPQFTGDRPANGAEAVVVAHPKGRKRWNAGGKRNVYRCPVNAGSGGAKPHPSTKPLALMLELLEDFTDPGDLVLDPFAGSGSTLVAAMRAGRRAIGIEMQEQWCAVAAERLEAERSGNTLAAQRAGQLPMFGGGA